MSYEPVTSGILDHALIQNMMEGSRGNGFVSGGVVSADGSDLQTDYTGFTARVNGTVITPSSGSVTHSAGDATNPRFDMVVVDSAGAVTIVAGAATAESATQSKPPLGTLPDGSLIMAVVYVPASASVILDANVYDRRVMALTGTPGAFEVFSALTAIARGNHAIGDDVTGLEWNTLRVGSDLTSLTASTPPTQLLVAGEGQLDHDTDYYWQRIQTDSGVEVSNGVSGANIASLKVEEPNITLTGSGSADFGFTLWIEAAPTEATTNYAVYVQDGNVKVDNGVTILDGDGTHVLQLPADATDPTSGGGAATGRIPVSIGGATRYLAYY